MIVTHCGENSEVGRHRQPRLALRLSVTVQTVFTRDKEVLIHAAFGSVIGADQRNRVSANQRFLLPWSRSIKAN
jgi:hypothetical protein